ncbi:MAG: hypothetical protein KatS3mg076_0778 [Candidatus Binatia bacterium]|nr:MAG: hypothetical protein KatS3mg076_0778 [Candidatus Binatia bacterium]
MAENPTKPTVENRWWAELGRPKETIGPKKPAPAGSRFYKVAEGYDQDRAREALTDLNLRLLREANPEEGKWSYLQLLPERFDRAKLEKIQAAVDLPPYARGLVVDSGRTIRLLVTGTPIGQRVLELALVEPPSFDCWVEEEWVHEELYRSRRQALARFRKLVRQYLSPEALAEFEAIRPRV